MAQRRKKRPAPCRSPYEEALDEVEQLFEGSPELARFVAELKACGHNGATLLAELKVNEVFGPLVPSKLTLWHARAMYRWVEPWLVQYASRSTDAMVGESLLYYEVVKRESGYADGLHAQSRIDDLMGLKAKDRGSNKSTADRARELREALAEMDADGDD